MDFPHFLEYALSVSASIKYFLLFVGAIVEGPVLMVAAGFFLHFGVFDLVPMFLVFVAGDLAGDVFWYYIGSRYAEPFLQKKGKFLGITMVRFLKVKSLFSRYHDWILIISKITIGFGMALATLMVAGATRVPFRRYMIINTIGEVLLVAILISTGYLFGELYNYIEEGFKLVFTIGAIVFSSLAIYGFSSYMKKIIAE